MRSEAKGLNMCRRERRIVKDKHEYEIEGLQAKLRKTQETWVRTMRREDGEKFF